MTPHPHPTPENMQRILFPPRLLLFARPSAARARPPARGAGGRAASSAVGVPWGGAVLGRRVRARGQLWPPPPAPGAAGLSSGPAPRTPRDRAGRRLAVQAGGLVRKGRSAKEGGRLGAHGFPLPPRPEAQWGPPAPPVASVPREMHPSAARRGAPGGAAGETPAGETPQRGEQRARGCRCAPQRAPN